MSRRVQIILVSVLVLLALLSAFAPGADFFGLRRTVVGLTEFVIFPAEVTAEPGETVEVTLENVGEQFHTWVVLRWGVEVVDARDLTEEMILFEAGAQPGQRLEVAFTAPDAPGTYQIICKIPGHLERGMEGTLRIMSLTDA